MDDNSGQTVNIEHGDTVRYNWVDVTSELKSACKELDLGELVHDAGFGLFEAMSAIEMMDPKMDVGMISNQPTKSTIGAERQLKEGLVKTNNLLAAELISIIDETFSCLVTWLDGYSLAQTVFTNVYLHDPTLVDDRTLRAFLFATLKIVDLIRDRILKASVFEEEDFQPMTYGFRLSCDVTDVRLLGMLKEVDDDLNRIVRNTRSKPGEERTAETVREHEEMSALQARVNFTKHFLSILIAFAKDKPQVDEVKKRLPQMVEYLSKMADTVHLGAQSDGGAVMGFEPLINQRLLPPTFPRSTRVKSRGESFNYFSSLCTDLVTICGAVDCVGLQALLDFMHDFSRHSPCILSRSLLQLIVLPYNNRRLFGTHAFADAISEAVKTFIMPPALSNRCQVGEAREYIDALLSAATGPVIDIIQTLGQNRARQRDRWAHILEELSTLQEEADRVDAHLHQFLSKSGIQHLAFFGTWVLNQTVEVMLHYVLSGLELELYLPYEYRYIFWYMSENLYSWVSTTLARADAMLEEAWQAEGGGAKGSKKNNKKKSKRTHNHELRTIRAQALQHVCSAFYKMVTGLTLDRKIKMPRVTLDNEEVRYSHRFAPFAVIATPHPIVYSHYKDLVNLEQYERPITSRDLYAGTWRSFQQARTLLEKIPTPSEEVQNLLKVIKTNMVVAKLLGDGHKKDSTVPVEFNFDSHRLFPVVKVV